MTETEMLEIGMEESHIKSSVYSKQFSSSQSFDYDDLYSWGCVGVINAIRMYDNSYGEFKPWCKIKVRGAILDGIESIIGHNGCKPHPNTFTDLDNQEVKSLGCQADQLDCAISSER